MWKYLVEKICKSRTSFWIIGYFEKFDFSIKIKAWEKFYRRRPAGSALGVHMIDIGVGVYALLSRVLTSEDKI